MNKRPAIPRWAARRGVVTTPPQVIALPHSDDANPNAGSLLDGHLHGFDPHHLPPTPVSVNHREGFRFVDHLHLRPDVDQLLLHPFDVFGNAHHPVRVVPLQIGLHKGVAYDARLPRGGAGSFQNLSGGFPKLRRLNVRHKSSL